MSTNRFNGFNFVHKALRLMLFETGTAIQLNDFTNLETTNALNTQIEFVLGVYEEHAMHENNLILPSVAKFNPVLVKHLEDDHAEDNQIGNKVTKAIKAWQSVTDNNARRDAGREILYAFSTFAAFNLAHMNVEETIFNDELWKHYTDEDILQLVQQIGKVVTPERTAIYNQWMLRALDPTEALTMLQGAQRTAPEAVFINLLKFAQENFSAEKWQYVNSGLSASTQNG